MCNAVLHTSGPVVVSDARVDERFADNPFVTGQIGLVRFYAASRLVTAAGVPIGTLCVFDTEPRTMSAEQYDALATLADRVVDVLELRLRTRQLERSLADLTATRDELHRSNGQLAGFVGQVSHDLRTPLTGVLGFVEELAELPAVTGDEQARWMAQRALASGERMRDLIEELLTYAQVGGSLRLAPVDLAEVATDAVHDLDTVLRDAGAVVRVDRLPVVHGDAVQLRALLQNLIANAAKFRRPGVAPRIVLSSRRVDDRWQVEVSDNGTGVAPDQRERVFELLARGEGVAAEGSGIGLATCKRIVEAHGGTIGVHDSPDGGASVRVALPVVD
jgi:signal transduction histidine kinase